MSVYLNNNGMIHKPSIISMLESEMSEHGELDDFHDLIIDIIGSILDDVEIEQSLHFFACFPEQQKGTEQ